MDAKPDPADVPSEIIDLIKEEHAWQQLCDEWDARYPDNPVSSDDEDEE